ncbi:serine hydrolase domain-containing protein [Natronoflexus pectinivorans]|uniref:CubicO group peptidase (Beta-lactamase class C family) n=1 Tax=Natronoflexus pectinivorans TaxID=682526 RepID=A0A4R2GL00_9BACT|nr:serine hydrolase domain-containing protein [Natronoflexus pectinivorans]TCO09247.1 CubicO group peptidase (beta-lactamase class C family) [Natronoflexus pectinivorans]
MHIKRTLLYLLIGIITGFGIKYTTGPSIKTFGTDHIPPSPMINSIRIPNALSNDSAFMHVDQQMNRFMNRWELMGASVAIAKDGQVVYARGFGYSDAENEIPVEPYHLFRTASISKLITAAGIMKLVEDGVIGLEDYVFGEEGILNFAPYNQYRDRNIERIQVIHLLNHSGGWTNRWGDPMFMPQIVARRLGKELPVNDEDIITFMLARPLHFRPGTMSAYSNLGYAILGKVIETVSGETYESFINHNILYPIGVYDMRIGGSFLEERADLEVKYYEPANTPLVEDFMGFETRVPRSYGGNDIETLGAAGGWIGSATDILQFLLAIDGLPYPEDILSKESIEIMTTPVSVGFQPLGWRGANSRQWFRTGTLSGTSTLMVRRDDGISYVILFNSNTWKGSMLSTDIRQLMDRVISLVDEWPEYDLFQIASNSDIESLLANSIN